MVRAHAPIQGDPPGLGALARHVGKVTEHQLFLFVVPNPRVMRPTAHGCHMVLFSADDQHQGVRVLPVQPFQNVGKGLGGVPGELVFQDDLALPTASHPEFEKAVGNPESPMPQVLPVNPYP